MVENSWLDDGCDHYRPQFEVARRHVCAEPDLESVLRLVRAAGSGSIRCIVTFSFRSKTVPPTAPSLIMSSCSPALPAPNCFWYTSPMGGSLGILINSSLRKAKR